LERIRDGKLVFIRFLSGEDLLETLERALREENLTSGVVMGGVGMIAGAALSYYVGEGKYETVDIEEPCELCALGGNVSTMDGDLVVHLHAVLGRPGGGAVAGHVSGGKVHMTGEVAILEVSRKMVRKLDPSTGLKLLALE
jgi:hypothetical protein